MKTGSETCARWIAIAAAALFVAAAAPARAYKPPAGPDSMTAYPEGDSRFNPHTHGWILLKAIDVLQGDGQAEIADFFRRHKQELLNGVRQADTANAFPLPFSIPILGREVPLNVFSHFYNPATARGFVLHLDEFAIIKT